MPTSVNTVRHLNQSPHANLPAGILSWGCNNWLLIQKRLSAFPSLSGVVGPLHSQCPHYLCSLFLINSFPSEMPWVWEFFSNLSLDCLNTLRPAFPWHLLHQWMDERMNEGMEIGKFSQSFCEYKARRKCKALPVWPLSKMLWKTHLKPVELNIWGMLIFEDLINFYISCAFI